MSMGDGVACVKGSIFASVVDDLKAAVREGRLSQDELEGELGGKDRALMDSVVTAVSWMPAAAYGRMLDLLARVDGGGRREAYLRERGARAAERLLSGTYGSFDAGRGSWGRRAGEMMVGIAGVLYDFTRWSFSETGPDAWEIVASDAKDLPDAAAHTAHGFLQWYLDRTSDGRVQAELTRPSPDRVVFRLTARR
jgi:hypothetical protein